ncbi:Ribosomal protein L23/L15e family protein [Euphorbia peplus]|nr:Ribosomal protein L23/L15e family protein [Euphorbia peplus]
MGSRVARRVIHFANLPIKLLMPSTFTNINEIALKTIPSASKVEIKRVLESLYGFEVDRVRTLNMEGKKKQRGGILFAKPDYKKAYVTLKHPLSISPDLFPLRVIDEEKERVNKQRRDSVMDDAEVKRHWLDGNKVEWGGNQKGYWRGPDKVNPKFQRSSIRGSREEERTGNEKPTWRGRGKGREPVVENAKFPWTSMRGSRNPDSYGVDHLYTCFFLDP